MAAMNVGEAIVPAINHTGRVLFRPFALRKWLALGFVSMLAAAGDGGFNFHLPGGSGEDDEVGRSIGMWISHHIVLIIVGAVLLFALGLAFSWLGSVMKFVYLNQITRDPYAIREPFVRLLRQGTSYFLWKLAFGLAMFLAISVLIGLSIFFLFVTHLTSNITAIVVAVIWCLLLVSPLIIVSAIIDIFARDFVSAAMFVRGVGVIQGWRIVLPILRQNMGQSALYVLLLIAIGLALGVAVLFVLLAVGVVFTIIGGMFALIGYGIYAAGGGSWSVALIVYAVAMGSILLLAFSYAMSCATQPLEVFRRAFSLVVLGQADASLATVPVNPPMQTRYRPGQETQ